MVIGHNPGLTAIITALGSLVHNELYLKALTPLPTCKFIALTFHNTQWSNIEKGLCFIEHVYWPTVNGVFEKKEAA